MRRLGKLLIFPAVLMLIAVGCTSEEGDGGDGGDGAANQEENTGTVNVLNAMEPEEADAVQALWESTYPDLDYTVDFEASADFEEQVQIRAEGGTLDVILLPQVGTIAGNYVPNGAVSLEDMGIDIDALNAQMSESFVVARRVRRAALRPPDEHQPQEHDLVPEGRLRRRGLHGADDVRRADRPVRPDRGRQRRRRGASASSPAGRHGWPATDWMEDIMLRTAGPDVYDQWVKHEIPFNDPAVVTAPRSSAT